MRRLLLVPLVLLPLTTAVPALADEPDVRVTAVVADAHGSLSFQHQKASGRSAGRQLATRWRGKAHVVATAVDARISVAGTPDPLQSQQWGLSALQADQLWATGDAIGQTVAVIDTGVDAAHPDLAGVVLPGTDLVTAGGDGRTDPNGHGTHVSGIIAAVAGNGIGVAGLAQGAHILPIRVMDATGSGYDSDAAAGLVWAADHGATVANLSLGGPDPSPVMDSAVSYAISKGVSVVVAAGNEGSAGNPVEYPAASPGVIAVAAVASDGSHPDWSSSGSHVSVGAPGVAITSTVPNGLYASWSGTSMATPFVAASVALLRHTQVLTPAQVRARLMATADDLGAPGFDPMFGAGRVNPLAAGGGEPVAAVAAPAVEPAPVAVAAPVVPITEAAPAAPVAPPLVAPVLLGKIYASRTSVPYKTAMTIATRTFADGSAVGGVAARLQRLGGGTWSTVASATTGSDGRFFWTVRPDRSAYYRVLGTGWTSPTVRITVTPVVQLSRYLTGRVLPGKATTVRLQRHLSTGWVTIAYAPSAADGTFRFTKYVATGTLVRAVALGVPSTAVRR